MGAWWNNLTSDDIINMGIGSDLFDKDATYSGARVIKDAGASVNANGAVVEIIASQNEDGSSVAQYRGKPVTDEVIRISEVTADLVFKIGGHAGPGSANCNHYKLQIYAEYDDGFLAQAGVETSEDGGIMAINTQELAQQALVRLDSAIVSKDQVRAHLGAMQNRLENTATNLSIQAENLRASESRISDADVALEMTLFVRNQILTQSAVAMLGQPNSNPHILASLLTA